MLALLRRPTRQVWRRVSNLVGVRPETDAPAEGVPISFSVTSEDGMSCPRPASLLLASYSLLTVQLILTFGPPPRLVPTSSSLFMNSRTYPF